LTIGGGKSVEDLEAEAAAWAVKLDNAPDQPLPGLEAWCARDPKHAGALLRAQAALALFDPATHAKAAPLDRKRPHGRRALAIAGGATAALAASFAAFMLIPSPQETYETRTGEIRSVALDDGSSVSIDARSRIEIAFNQTNRDVHLLSGKALFHAAHNAQRPFRVIVGNIVVTDIGTTFQVADDDPSGQVDVLVTQGAVRVASPAGQITLTTGQHARFSQLATGAPRPRPLRMAPVDIDRILAWREGRLELDGETLDSAVADMNRHNQLHLRVGNAALGRESLYGSFRMDDATGFARAAAMSLGTDTRMQDGSIVIGAKKNKRGQ
jgi:transmembrane sensor